MDPGNLLLIKAVVGTSSSSPWEVQEIKATHTVLQYSWLTDGFRFVRTGLTR